jgi:hypothetical protein
MSEWRDIRNRQALARLNRALPDVFPRPVLTHALERALTPPMPRLAVDSYWRAHPLRADRLARALAALTGAPADWRWQFAGDDSADAPAAKTSPSRRKGPRQPGIMRGAPSFRTPPAPYREQRFTRGPGFCCVCGQPVYRFGWHVDLWGRGPNTNAVWHAACVVAWDFWTAPSDYVAVLRRLQRRGGAVDGGRLWKTAEVDHRVPLFRVWREHRALDWSLLLRFWGLPNLQVINRERHVDKCAVEARQRRTSRSADLVGTNRGDR